MRFLKNVHNIQKQCPEPLKEMFTTFKNVQMFENCSQKCKRIFMLFLKNVHYILKNVDSLYTKESEKNKTKKTRKQKNKQEKVKRNKRKK